MVRKSLLAVSLALLAGAAARPAAADPKWFEPYSDIFGGRVRMATPGDPRAKDVIQTQPTRKENPGHRFSVGPFIRTVDLGRLDLLYIGGGIAYDDVRNPRNPWSININYANLDADLELGARDLAENFGLFDINAKYVLWQSENANEPVVSIVGRYQDMDDLGHRWDVLLAADHQIMTDVYATANLGFGDFSADNRHLQSSLGGDSDFIAGFGLQWAPSRWNNLSFFANYVLDNDVDGDDDWGAGVLLTTGRTSAFKLGGGKHKKFFGQYIAKFD